MTSENAAPRRKRQSGVRSRIIDMLSSGPMLAQDILDKGGFSPASLYLNLKALKSEGSVDTTREGRAVRTVAALGATLTDLGPWSAQFQLRYFGPRPLIEDNSVRSKGTTLAYLRVGHQLTRDVKVALDVFNVFNRHGNAHLSWETPLLYGAMMVWLLTPMVVWGLLRAPGAWLRQPALPWLVVVPLSIFGLLSLVKTIGLHWVFSFVPLVFLLYGRSVSDVTLQRTIRFAAVIAAVHVAAVLAVASQPVERWASLLGERKYAGVVQTVKADEVIAALGDDVNRYELMTDGYSPSVTVGYNHRRYWPVFGPASSHARHDDMLTDFRRLDGRDVLVLSKEAPELTDYTPYFRDVQVDPLTVRGAKFWRIRGHGFDFAAYHAGVLEPARRYWYAIPGWLPQQGCYFEERYFR